MHHFPPRNPVYVNGTPSRDLLPEFAISQPNHAAVAYAIKTAPPTITYKTFNMTLISIHRNRQNLLETCCPSSGCARSSTCGSVQRWERSRARSTHIRNL